MAGLPHAPCSHRIDLSIGATPLRRNCLLSGSELKSSFAAYLVGERCLFYAYAAMRLCSPVTVGVVGLDGTPPLCLHQKAQTFFFQETVLRQGLPVIATAIANLI